MLLVGLAIGGILGGVLEATTTMTEPAAYLSMVLLWGGLSLIVFYGVHKKVLSDE
jgi:hypothetical protein